MTKTMFVNSQQLLCLILFICEVITPHGINIWNIYNFRFMIFKSCKLGSKTRAKVFGKVDTFETYQGGAPVSYHHHTPIFTVFLSSIILAISRSSRIKFWFEFVLSFALWSLYVIESMSYIIKISVESRAWFSCYDLGWIKEKRKRIRRNKSSYWSYW